MSTRNRLALAVAITGLLLALPSLTRQLGTTSAQSPSAQPSVVVLRSGQVLQGQVARLDNRYSIRLGEGNELRLAATDVDFIANSLDEACQRKQARVRPGSIDDQVLFAEWCLRQGLIRQAAQATTDALRLAPEDTRVTSLERRLNALIQPASTDEPASDPKFDRPTSSQLDHAARDLPPGAVQRFTMQIQPLLLNRCATAGCHGNRSTAEYRLLRPALGQSANRRLTQQNLLNTVAWLDRANPDASPLLTRARSAHGGASKSTGVTLEQAQYEPLADWVRLATQTASKIRPSTIDGDDPKLLQTAQKLGTATTESSDEPARRQPPPSRTRAASSGAAPGSPPAAAPETSNNLVDPFDPEVFNRRYGKKD